MQNNSNKTLAILNHMAVYVIAAGLSFGIIKDSISSTMIWSGSGMLILFLIASFQFTFYLLEHIDGLKEMSAFSMLSKSALCVIMFYVFGILIGSVAFRIIGFDASVTPMISFIGLLMSLWCAIVGVIVGMLFFKLND